MHRLSHKYSASKRVLLNVLTEKLKVVTLRVSLECYRKISFISISECYIAILPAKEGLKSNCEQKKTGKELTCVVVQVFTEAVETGDQLHDSVSQYLHLDT